MLELQQLWRILMLHLVHCSLPDRMLSTWTQSSRTAMELVVRPYVCSNSIYWQTELQSCDEAYQL